MVLTIDNFFGVYLLNSINPKHKGAAYIGFTVNPQRRIKQHNSGKEKGGARKTDKKRPWKMVLIVHGFTSQIAALRFEWAWQNPTVSLRLNHLPKKNRNERDYDYRLRILCEMLHQAPWKRFPLTVRWLDHEYEIELNPTPPMHMPIAFGPVSAKLRKHNFEEASDEDIGCSDQDDNDEQDFDDSDGECPPLFVRINASKQPHKKVRSRTGKCFLCNEVSEEPGFFLNCLRTECRMVSHAQCLAKQFLKDAKEEKDQIIPVQGSCPSCHFSLLWGDLIRKYHGYGQHFT